MIKVKAFKDDAEKASLGRADYLVVDDKKYNLAPVVLVTFLFGCVAYLKSFLPVALKAAEHPLPNDRCVSHSDDTAAPVSESVALDRDDEDIEDKAGNEQPEQVKAEPVLFAPQLDRTSTAAIRSNVLDFDSQSKASLVRSNEDTAAISDGVAPPPKLPGEKPSLPTGAGGGGGGGGDEQKQSRNDPNESKGAAKSQSTDPSSNKSTATANDASNLAASALAAFDADRNRAPRVNGPVSLQNLVGCHAYLITFLSLLQGASDADGEPLMLDRVSSSSGTLTPTDGGWLFTPDEGMRGGVTLTYGISDGHRTVMQMASFDVIDAPAIVGTDLNDDLLGTECAETVEGRDGNDRINARGGNDVIVSGDGNDYIVGGTGNDTIYAGRGNDLVFAGSGNDIVFGGAGDDRLFGEYGDDQLYGEDGDDLISGGNGADTLAGNAGNDTLDGDDGDDNLSGGDGHDVASGGDGHDRIAGNAGNDVLAGNTGNDTLDGGDGDDNLSGGNGEDNVNGGAGNDRLADGTGMDDVVGGSGNDTIVAAADGEADRFRGGEGVDTLDYSAGESDLYVDVAQGSVDGSDTGRDLFSEIEHIVGGSGNDRFDIGSDSMTITGGSGNDTFSFEIELDRHRGQTAWKITDFTVGDRLIVDRFHIYETNDGKAPIDDDDFASVYPPSGNSQNLDVRFRFETRDDVEETFVDIWNAIDSTIVSSIEMNGHHNLEVFSGIS